MGPGGGARLPWVAEVEGIVDGEWLRISGKIFLPLKVGTEGVGYVGQFFTSGPFSG